jgi:AAA domain
MERRWHNAGCTDAAAIDEQNPVACSMFGSIEYQAEEDVRMTDFTRIRAGSLLKAHGGFLMLHLRNLLARRTGVGITAPLSDLAVCPLGTTRAECGAGAQAGIH